MATHNTLEHVPSVSLASARARQQDMRLRYSSIPSNDLQAARSLRGATTDFELVEGGTSDALGLLKGKVSGGSSPLAHDNKQHDAAPRPHGIDFSAPATRAMRLTTPDGRTSFHFALHPVTKASVTRTDGRAVTSSSGAAHGRYIERDSAVAREEQRETTNDRTAPDGVVAAAGDGHDAYIRREEALATQPDGSRVLFTNIDADPDKRDEFWQLVEKRDRVGQPDIMSFQITTYPEFWSRVLARVDSPQTLKEALLHSKPDDRITLGTGDNSVMQGFLSDIEGYEPMPRRNTGETKEDYAKRREQVRKIIDFTDGRDGRVQYRIVGELPCELDVQGRAQILHQFTKEFEKRELPFVAVMHAPDYANNEQNWHFHLIYHDRPARRLTAADVAEPSIDWNTRNKALTQIGRQHIGAWDFDVEQAYLTSSRQQRLRFPYRQDKLREVTRDGWIKHLRARLGEITNEQLERANVSRRVDPRCFETMGIEAAQPQEHLSTKASALESIGTVTGIGTDNERKQWTAVNKRIDRHLAQRRDQLSHKARDALVAVRAAPISGTRRQEAETRVVRRHRLQFEAVEHKSIADRADQFVARLQSRATKVIATCTRHLGAIADGTASAQVIRTAAIYRQRKADAETFLVQAVQVTEQDQRLAHDCRAAACRNESDANLLWQQIGTDVSERRLPTAGSVARRVEPPGAAQQRQLDLREIELLISKLRTARLRLRKKAEGFWVDSGEARAQLGDQLSDEAIVQVLREPHRQSRLEGIYTRQEREIRRLSAYVAAQPNQLVIPPCRNRHDLGLGPHDCCAGDLQVRWRSWRSRPPPRSTSLPTESRTS